ncbi:MAG: hypothetical protein KDJ68_14780 [Rhodobiaceae bacterium]|nr:hypothetical protein [Paracoccaceae bacterium]MCB1474096.1 hypothetical protein [Rhodobiaceae bacterium]
MPHEETPVAKVALACAAFLDTLEPGLLAEARRRRSSTAFWRMRARHAETIGSNEDAWKDCVRILAVLTHKGQPEARMPLHNPRRRLGSVLCDGGDAGWPRELKLNEKPRPWLTELRFARLLAARGSQRPVQVERIARALARSLVRGGTGDLAEHDGAGKRLAASVSGPGVNVADIAWALLNPGNTDDLARHYYDRLDRAERKTGKERERADA